MAEPRTQSPPPDGGDLVPLLVERWPIKADETLAVEVDADNLRIGLRLTGPRHGYALDLTLEQARSGADSWSVLVDAVDALFGQLIENGRDYRRLPSGSGVAHEGSTFEVMVEHRVPEVEKLADRFLAAEDRDDDE